MSHPVKRGGRQIGKMVEKDNGDLHYVTERKEDKKGFVRKHHGFGINANALEGMIQQEADLIVVRYHWEEGGQSLYKLTPRQFLHLGTKDRLGNFEPQYFVSEALFKSQGEVMGREVGRAKMRRHELQKQRKQQTHRDAAQMRLDG